MRPVVTVEEMRAVDAEALERVAESVLVERAGTALAVGALGILGGAYGRRVVVVAGRGNNGADGRVAAARLQRRGARVSVVEAAAAPARIDGVDLVIDAAYGTGFRGTYDAPEVPSRIPVVAADIPSGVSGDTGEACGSPMVADLTVTFAGLKPGLLQGDGRDLAGRVVVADIGLDVGRARIALIEDGDVDRLLPARPREAHKWQAAVAVVAGSPGMTGAAGLCAGAAYRAGAGMVRLGVPGAALGELPATEAVGARLPADGWSTAALDVAARCQVLVVGPGLGRAEGTAAEVRRLVAESPVPVVVDADGLFALGDFDEVASVAGRGDRPVVLTPHAGEFARLQGSPAGADHFDAARRAAARAGAVVLLKGSTTSVAEPGGRVLVSTAGSARLATAGTGDVLSGVIGAFVARGVPAFEAAALAAHVHGRAAGLGPAQGLVAGDLGPLVARWLSDRPAVADPAVADPAVAGRG